MTQTGNVFLMYHELEMPGRRVSQSEPGYVRYVLKEEEFVAQMGVLAEAGWRGSSVGQALASTDDNSVVLTFDDGCETDLISAAPVLLKHKFGATFYVVTGFLGRAGSMSQGQARELAASGFEIGCHSQTHPYLPELSMAELHREIAVAKQELEQILGRPVEHFSCPGGQFDARVFQVAREAGYRSVSTSQVRRNAAGADPFGLGRVAILRGMPLGTYRQICDGSLLWRLRLKDSANRTAKRVLGNSSYDRLRTALLGKG